MAPTAAGSRAETRARILNHIKTLHAQNPCHPGISIPTLAVETAKSVGYVRIIINELEAEGHVKKGGQLPGGDGIGRRTQLWTFDPTQGRTP